MSTATVNGQALTLAQLAAAKHLPVEYLRSLGLHDLPGGGIAIPYYSEDGGELLYERTRDVPGGPRFRQPAGVRLHPYGLWRLEEARRTSSLHVAEGESDTWVLWHAGLPALGLPGAQTCRCLTLEHLHGIQTLYLWPDRDQAGDGMVQLLLAHVAAIGYGGRVYLVRLPEGVKDVSDLYVADPDGFAARAADLVAGAEVLHLPGCSAPSRGAAAGGEGGRRPARQIIHEHMERLYRPTYRDGPDIWSAAEGRKVTRTEAVGQSEDGVLHAALEDAAEMPRDDHGYPRRGATPRLYRDYSRAAWGDLHRSLPLETDDGEVEPTAEAAFRRRLGEALTRQVTMDVPTPCGRSGAARRQRDEDRQPQARHQEQRTLLDWAIRWARPGRWERIRSWYIWSRLDGQTVRVAIRPELLGRGQLHMPDLAELGQAGLSRLCERYGLGEGCRVGHGGQRGIEIAQALLQDLQAAPGDGDEVTEASQARGTGDPVTMSPQEPSSCQDTR
jgi:hypothetical protein